MYFLQWSIMLIETHDKNAVVKVIKLYDSRLLLDVPSTSTYMHVARHVDSRVGISRDRDRPMRIRTIDRSGIGTPRIACTWPGQVGDVYFFRFASRLEAPFCCWFCVSFDLPFAGSCHHPGFIVRRRHCFNYVTTVSWMNLSRNFVIKKFEWSFP